LLGKESIGKQDIENAGRGAVCPTCGHSTPYHALGCSVVHGLCCSECEQRLPRHYPWCSRGQELGFFAWNLNCTQREADSYFQEHMKMRAAQRASGGQ